VKHRTESRTTELPKTWYNDTIMEIKPQVERTATYTDNKYRTSGANMTIIPSDYNN